MPRMTLLDQAARLPLSDPSRTHIEEYARSSPVLTYLGFDTEPTGIYSYTREYRLPNLGFRGLNESFGEDVGIVNPQFESVKIMGGDIAIDTALVERGTSRSEQEIMAITAMSGVYTRAFFKGDTAYDPREFDGLQKRITGSQLIENSAAGSALSLYRLDEMIDAVRGESLNGQRVLYMNRTMARRLSQSMRDTGVAGMVQYSLNEAGRRVMFYNDIPIEIIDEDHQDNRILDFTEASPDGTATNCCSIYCVVFGDMAVKGIQQKLMNVRELGESSDRPVYKTRVDWSASFAIRHGRAAARLFGIQDAAVVA